MNQLPTDSSEASEFPSHGLRSSLHDRGQRLTPSGSGCWDCSSAWGKAVT